MECSNGRLLHLWGIRKRIKRQTQQVEKEYERLKTEGLRKLSADQKFKLKAARLQLKEAKNERDTAKQTADTYKRLFAKPGHGGVSKQETQKKESFFLKAESNYQQKMTDLQSLELEFSKQHSQVGKKIDDTYMKFLQLQIQYEDQKQKIENAEIQMEMQYKSAVAAWEAASRVSFDDLDQNYFLKISSPVAGEITNVFFTQPGEKVQSNTPLVSIAPSDSEKILLIDILDKDRGQLRVGQTAKLKFIAFPYQRHGFINGKIKRISPTAKSSQGGIPLHEGRISLERDHFMVNGEKIKLSYGMTAIAEIVVQERRLIEMILEPFMKLEAS